MNSNEYLLGNKFIILPFPVCSQIRHYTYLSFIKVSSNLIIKIKYRYIYNLLLEVLIRESRIFIYKESEKTNRYLL